MAVWTYTITDQYYYSHMTLVNNANNIKDYLEGEGFSAQAIIGIIANMEHESYLNPGQQEFGRNGSESYGYGLVQWTPARSKLLAYAATRGNWYDGDLQMDYLMINVPQSWIQKDQYPYSWADYKNMTDIYLATEVFFYNFERGTFHEDLYTYAEFWAAELYGITPPTPPPTPPTPPTPPDPPDPSVDEDLLYLAFKMTKVLK